MLTLFGAFDPAEGLNRPAFLTFMAIGAFGTLLTAAYMLVVVRRVCMGEPPARTGNATGLGAGPGSTEAAGTTGTPVATRTAVATSTAATATDTTVSDSASTTEIADVRPYEFATWTPLVALTVLAGLWPAVLLGLSDPAVQKLLAGGKS